MTPHLRKCILGCPRGATLHKFPSDEEKRKLWLKIINLENCPLKNLYICTRHFSKDVKGKLRTTWNAVPNTNLRRIDSDEELESEYSESEVLKPKILQRNVPIKTRSKKLIYLPKDANIVETSNNVGVFKYDPLHTSSKNLNVVKHKVKVVKGNALKIRSTDSDEVTSYVDTIEEMTKSRKNLIKYSNSSTPRNSITKQRLKIIDGKAYKINIEKDESISNLGSTKKLTSPLKVMPSTSKSQQNKLKSKLKSKTQKLSKHNLSQTRIFQTEILPSKVAKNSRSNSSFIINESSLTQMTSSDDETIFMEENWDNYTESSERMKSQDEDEDGSIQYYEVVKTEPLSVNEDSTESINTNSKKKRQKCGFIERFTGNNTFSLVCYFCPTEFELWDWEKFIQHLRVEHKNGNPRKKYPKIKTEDEIKLEKNPTEIEKVETTLKNSPKKHKNQKNVDNKNSTMKKAIEENSDDAIKKDFIHFTKDDNVNEIERVTETQYENVEIYIENEENHDDDSENWPIDTVEDKENVIEMLVEKIEDDSVIDEIVEDIDRNIIEETDQEFIEQEVDDEIIEHLDEQEFIDEDEAYEIQNQEQVGELDDGDYTDQHTEEDQRKEYRGNSAVINFKSTSPERILNFLNTLQAHPLLWHSRRAGTILHDDEVEKFLKEFGDESMSPIDFRRSMDHVRYQHRRFTPITANLRLKLQNDGNLRKYYQIINKIVELSAPLIHQCEHCTFYYFDKAGLNTHMYVKHKIGNLPFVCSCGYRFAEKTEKEDHEHLHKLNPRFLCEVCNEAFVLQRLLNDHMNQSHPEVCEDPLPYKCNKCDAEFSTRLKRQYHMMKHVVPRFTCDQCGQSYKTRFRYKIHLKSHTDQRDFVCEHCGKAFLEKRHLNEHRFRVHRDGGLQCQYCHTFYSCRESLEEHNQKFHPNGTNLDRMKKIRRYFNSKYNKNYEMKSTRVYKCKYCGEYFERMWELVKHKRTTGHNLQIYHCPDQECSATLSSTKTLIGHLQRVHKLSISNTAQIDNLIIEDVVDDDIKMEEAEYIEEIDIQTES